MLDRTYFDTARWLLVRLALALLAALAVAVIARQFTGDGNEGVSQQPTQPVSGPKIGRDHWHAVYHVFVCGRQQPVFPLWLGGIHTHTDGIIHIHPFTASEEGMGARLVKWFEYGGGMLTQTEMRMPGSSETLTAGDSCDDGREAALEVFVNGDRLDDWSQYIPQDGDRIRIVFGVAEPE